MIRFRVSLRPSAVAGIVAAQKKPDFSGEWTLDRRASVLSPAASGVQGGVVVIQHHEPQFHHKATLQTQTTPIEYEWQFVSDGNQVVSTQAGATTTMTSLRWDGEALALSSLMQRGAADTSITFRYELIDSGRRLRATEKIRGAREQDNVRIFDRQQ